MKDLEPSEISDYACEDADITMQLKQVFDTTINDPELNKLFQDIEMPLVDVLVAMEYEGINLDNSALGEFSVSLGKSMLELHDGIIADAGTEFNVDSPKQLGEVLFDHLKIDEKAKKTKTGQYKTDEQTLSKLENKHEIIRKILDYRQQKKLKSTYVDATEGASKIN